MSQSPFAEYPTWARTLAHGIRARLANTFVLHGNTHDLVPVPQMPAAEVPADAGSSPARFVPIVTFLADWIFGQRDVVIERVRARNEMARAHNPVLQPQAGPDALVERGLIRNCSQASLAGGENARILRVLGAQHKLAVSGRQARGTFRATPRPVDAMQQ